MAVADITERFTRALLRQGIPITGVTMTDPDTRATWAIAFAPAATQVQRDAGAALLASFDPTDPATIAADRLAQFTLSGRQKDVLAMCALVVRARGIPAWNAMTTPQKVTAALAEADVWTTIRDFLETNA